jgi:hypothetical protein
MAQATRLSNQSGQRQEQAAAYVRVISEPRGSLCYRMTGQLSPETKAKNDDLRGMAGCRMLKAFMR